MKAFLNWLHLWVTTGLALAEPPDLTLAPGVAVVIDNPNWNLPKDGYFVVRAIDWHHRTNCACVSHVDYPNALRIVPIHKLMVAPWAHVQNYQRHGSISTANTD